MTPNILRLIMTITAFIVITVSNKIIFSFIEKYGQDHRIKRKRRMLLGRFLTFVAIALFLFVLLCIWEDKEKNLWLIVTSMSGIIGIAFFASWSFLSNVFAGFLLFYSTPFRINDVIVIRDGDKPVKGEVVNMTLFFVVLEDENGHSISIPNNVMLQKVVEVQRR